MVLSGGRGAVYRVLSGGVVGANLPCEIPAADELGRREIGVAQSDAC